MSLDEKKLVKMIKALNKQELLRKPIKTKGVSDTEILVEDFIQAIEELDDDGKSTKIKDNILDYYDWLMDELDISVKDEDDEDDEESESDDNEDDETEDDDDSDEDDEDESNDDSESNEDLNDLIEDVKDCDNDLEELQEFIDENDLKVKIGKKDKGKDITSKILKELKDKYESDKSEDDEQPDKEEIIEDLKEVVEEIEEAENIDELKEIIDENDLKVKIKDKDGVDKVKKKIMKEVKKKLKSLSVDDTDEDEEEDEVEDPKEELAEQLRLMTHKDLKKYVKENNLKLKTKLIKKNRLDIIEEILKLTIKDAPEEEEDDDEVEEKPVKKEKKEEKPVELPKGFKKGKLPALAYQLIKDGKGETTLEDIAKIVAENKNKEVEQVLTSSLLLVIRKVSSAVPIKATLTGTIESIKFEMEEDED